MAHAYTIQRRTGRRPGAPSPKPGNWKLAYADFLTALCAFFLVMWIVNGVSAEDKAELAQQFNAEASPPAQLASESQTLAEQLRNDARLAEFGASVRVTHKPDIVRIDLTDMAVRPLFDNGHGALNETGEALVAAAGYALRFVPGKISVEGHTDSNPSQTPGYSNWELSADRANSARRILETAGVDAARFQGVTGLSHTKPLLEDAPHLPANRRISIVVQLSHADPA